jgi:hypothetical protein
MPYEPNTDQLPARQDRARRERGRYLDRAERACVFKQKHTQASAGHEARRLQALGEDRARAYECPNPGCRCRDRRAWHVGRTRRGE